MIPKTIAVVGLARNLEGKVIDRVKKYNSVFSSIAYTKWLIIESDSSDGTLLDLNKLSTDLDNFKFISLGSLSSKYSLRTERISFCRNRYIKELINNSDYIECDHVVVMDMDGVNDMLTSKSLKSCFERSSWDVCAANQDGPYYDVWALRHTSWSPNDCWAQARYLHSRGLSIFKSVFSAVYSRMITIHPSSEWIEVDSAFGGLAIYKKDLITSVNYVGLIDDGEEVCEHVSAHQQIRSVGGRIFINPALINAGIVEHARNATSIGLLRLCIRCQIQKLGFMSKNSLIPPSVHDNQIGTET